MANSNNLLNKLRQNRQRSVVPPRQDTLVAPSSENPLAPQLESQSDPQQPVSQDIPAADATLEQLKAELAKFPSTRRHSAIVLAEEIDQNLTRFCKDQGVTVETFLEAAWEVASSDAGLLRQMVEAAKRRYNSRKEAGRLRRLITMLSKT
jgi:hypothetical protein